MYVPSHYAEPRSEVIHGFLRANPFCSLVTADAGGLFASHLPVIFDATSGERGVLRGHLARANPHRTLNHSRALAIFLGPDGYVSPSFYPSKREHGKVVPTWNYTVVHVAGTVEFIDDPVFVRRNVEDLTTLMESNREHPWKVSDAPEDYIEKMLRAIVGVELRVQEIQAKWKLSQNRSPADFEGILNSFATSPDSGAQLMVEAMQQMVRS